MAVPTSYTEATFKEYLDSLLAVNGFAADLGWVSNGGQYNNAVDEALIMMGVSDIATVPTSDINKLRIAGRVALWQLVVDATVQYMDASTPDGARANLSQIHAHALKALERAESDAANIGLSTRGQARVNIVGVQLQYDPYRRTRYGDEYA